MKQFPKFFYSNPKNPGATGPVIFHLNFPRCTIREKEKTVTITWLDEASEQQKDKVKNDFSQWHGEFFNQQTKK